MAIALIVAVGAALIVASCTSWGSQAGGTSNTPLASIASFDAASPGTVVDGIQCQTNEQVAYHVHSHVAIFVNGAQRLIPMGIGVAPPRQIVPGKTGPFAVGSCFYWLHSHETDGIIHIESPSQRIYTLGDYFDIWHQPLSATQVGPARGPVIAYVDGHRVAGSPRDIELRNHVKIQLDVGTNVPPAAYTFPKGL